MPRDARFWRNVTIIAVAHIAIIIALIRWNRETRKPNLQSIVWMNGGGTEVAARTTPAQTETAIEKTPPPEADTPRSKPEEQDEPPVPTPARSDIQLRTATPSPTPVTKPPPKPSMTPVSKASPKPTPKATPKKTVVVKATPKPSPRKKATPVEQEKKNDENRKEAAKIAPANANSVDGEKSGSTGPNGAVRASEFSWYGKMLHDRFYSEWIQPTTSVAIGAKMSALVKIRIEKDGRVSNFTIVRPSGNVVVDESVAAVAKRVTQVDPLPKGLGSGAHYEVNINFELKPEL
ncbi:MAG TPA: TonB family protein [Chthoniobacterales bacterium]